MSNTGISILHNQIVIGVSKAGEFYLYGECKGTGVQTIYAKFISEKLALEFGELILDLVGIGEYEERGE